MRSFLILVLALGPVAIAAVVVSWRAFVEFFFPNTRLAKKYRNWRYTPPPWEKKH